MQRNRLAGETSPYLLQHADNPVNWYPWGEAALEAAQRENKPILLSIGYSACHWCHVMAHESFADRTTAELMNASFINIKVDREERPDLDKIYQLAQQLITQGSGGWPLTMFLTPEDRQPFFGGTYFPKDARFGMPAFTEILQRVSNYYRGHRKEIANQNELLTRAFAALTPRGAFSDVVLDDSPLQAARVALEETFDAEYGGFSQAPKFPNAPAIERALRHWSRTAIELDPDLKAMYMAALTLTRMAQGGIYDQLGGGFARYSVDRYWMIPHFEKMLYDNGQLLGVYAAAARATGEPLFRRVAGETADWALRDMRSPEGAFYSSLDADSEGHEGKFYVWSRSAIQALLDADEFSVVSRRFGLDRAANFQGAWHLHACESIDDSAPAQTLDTAREKLLSARNLKVWPARDEKILSAWNALMIKGLAIAARVLRRPDLAEAAAAAVDFIYRKLWRQGRLLAAYTDGRAHLHAYLDDYAFLADALLELLQARWRSSDLRFAQQLLDVLLDKFEDRDGGGFFFTAVDHERLIHRSKTFGDDSVPSGNAIAASALYRFGLLLGDSTYLDAAERTLKAAWPMLQEYPQAHLSLVNALEDSQLPLQILIIRGEAADARRWADELGTLFAPTRMIFAIPADAENLPSAIGGKLPGAGTVAYLCSGMTCSAPITNLGEIARALTARVSA